MRKLDGFESFMAVALVIAVPGCGYLGWLKAQVLASGCTVNARYFMCSWYTWLAHDPVRFGFVFTTVTAIGLWCHFKTRKNKH